MHVTRRLIAVVLAGAVTFAGCTSLKTVRPASPGEPPFGPVRKGDTVVVQTRDGASARFVVQHIDGETIVAADGSRYVRSELLDIHRQAISGPKTAALVGVIAGGVFAVVAIAVGRWLGENSR